jgi:L-seryl-tRNA(Ser) seleniumtransferase
MVAVTYHRRSQGGTLIGVEFSKLPKVDRLVDDPDLAASRASIGRAALVAVAREVVSEYRTRVKAGEPAPPVSEVVSAVRREALRREKAAQRRVINATGVVLHTNLGRAPLAARSLENVAAVLSGYSSVEFDVESGERKRRGSSAEAALAALVSAGAALIVNNNAAAVLLALTAVAGGREVLVSRGELVEIGGGFRIPEILARSGATLVEVGTTNRTRIDDYERAITDRTACILRVHPSNFEVTGFAERPALADVVRLAHARGLPLLKDLGGGVVVSRPRDVLGHDLAREPTVQSCLEAGADLVCFSLDKLFGGPQGGAVVGARDAVEKLRKDPLARAVRVDKLMLAALEPVIAAYAHGDYDSIPILKQLRTPLDALRRRAEGWRESLGAFAERCDIVGVTSATGGGTLASDIPSVALAISVEAPDKFAHSLRAHEQPVIARIEEGRVLLDPRTVLPGEDDDVVAALRSAIENSQRR